MLHLRIVSPPDRVEAVLDALRSEPAVAGLSVVPGASLVPPGDLVMCDVAREGGNAAMQALRDLDVHHEGSIAVEQVEVVVSDAAARAERRAPGFGSDAAVWEEVDARVRDESVLSAGFLVFIVVAALLAAVGLVQDSSILVVGAMVVGPEFGPIAGLSVGIFKGRWWRIRTALVTLVVGLAAAIAVTFLATDLADALDLVPASFTPHDQPMTGFVVDPSTLSFVVAFLAGIVGTLSLTQAKSGALVGVLISVTTIPAMAAVGVAGALGHGEDALGAAVQLGLNLSALMLAGVLTLWAQRVAWDALLAAAGRRRASRTSRAGTDT